MLRELQLRNGPAKKPAGSMTFTIHNCERDALSSENVTRFKVNRKRGSGAVISYQSLVVSYQLSAIGCKLSAASWDRTSTSVRCFKHPGRLLTPVPPEQKRRPRPRRDRRTWSVQWEHSKSLILARPDGPEAARPAFTATSLRRSGWNSVSDESKTRIQTSYLTAS